MGLVAALAAANVWFAVQGRTGYIVMAVLLLWLAYSRWLLRGLVASAIGLALLLAAAWHWAPAFQQRIDQAVTEARDYRVQFAPGETSIGIRLHFAKRSLDALAQRPVLGAGTGAWGEAFYEATASDPTFFHDRAHQHPHNEYLMLAVQLGPLGLLLFVALLVTAFRRARQLPQLEAELARGLVLAFATGSLFGSFYWDMTEGHIWAVLGGALFGASLNPASAPQRG
jgi:O-antigen ligase